MVHLSKTAQLDAAFAALSDATRRGVLEQLGRADASITDLANRFDMTLTGMKKHVGVLENAGLVATDRTGGGQRDPCRRRPKRSRCSSRSMPGGSGRLYEQEWNAAASSKPASARPPRTLSDYS